MPVIDLNQKIADLLAHVPEAQRPAAGALIAQYGPRLFDMAIEEAWAYLRRLMAGDLNVVAELDLKLSDDAFLAMVEANTALWANVAAYNKLRDDLRSEMILRIAPIMLTILLALVGL